MMNITTQVSPSGVMSGRYRAATVVRAARVAMQWRLLTLWFVVLLIPTGLSALPFWQLLSTSMDHSVHAAQLASSLDLSTIADLVATSGRNPTGIGAGNRLALLVTLLLSPFLSGMTIHAARASEATGFGALVSGGLQEYPRLLRMLLWALVPMGVAAGLAGAGFFAAHKYAEKAVLESSAFHVELGAMLLAALLFVIADASLDAGRAVLASDRRRRSAVKAWWAGFKLLLSRKRATLGTYFGITLVGLALTAAFAIARLNVPALGIGGFIAAFVLTQLAVVSLAWMRSARLFAMLELVRSSRP
jgi:hypothetical protein